MLVLHVHLKAASGRASELESVLRRLVDHAGTEVGVIFYGAARVQQEPDRFMLSEYYTDRTAFDNHLAQPKVQALLHSFESLLAAAPELTFCDSVAGTGQRHCAEGPDAHGAQAAC